MGCNTREENAAELAAEESMATLTPVPMEVARMRHRRPSFAWVEGYEVTTPAGATLAPYMRKREALKFCRDNGWTVRVKL